MSMNIRRIGLLVAALGLALLVSVGAHAATYAVHVGGTNTGLDWSSVSGAFNAAIAAAGDHTIEIQDNNGGSGYTEPRMDIPVAALGNITITAPNGAVTITASAAQEIFRNRSNNSPEITLTITGKSAAEPITLTHNNAVAIVNCETPDTLTRNGLLHIENVIFKKSTAAASGPFLRIDSRATGQQYLKNVTFIGGISSNTNAIVRAGSASTTAIQSLYMENVSFSQANGTFGMMLVSNNASISAKSCVFRPASGSSMPCVRGAWTNAGTGTLGGSQLVFRDCEFQSKNGGTNAADAFTIMGDTFQVSPNVYKLYRPAFFNCGQEIFDLDDDPVEVYVLGLDDSDLPTVSKVDLDNVPSTTSRFATIRGNGKFVMRNCKATDGGGSLGNKTIGNSTSPALSTLTGNPTVILDRCDFDGTGHVIFNSTGGAFAPVISISNSILQGNASFQAEMVSTQGANTGIAQVTLTHSTLTHNGVAELLKGNSGDQIYGPGSIFDATGGTSVCTLALQSSSVPALAWTSLGTSGFASAPGNTVVANPNLGSTGRLTSSSVAAFNAATGSTATFDIDNDARPLPAGAAANDLGADEASFGPTDITLSSAVISEDAANNDVVGTFSVVDPDANSTLSLTNNGGGAFALSGNDLVVANTALLDGVNTPSVTVEVKATDLGGAEYSETFSITVTHTPASVTAVDVIDGNTVRITFSRGMGASALSATNYSVSGSGLGSFATNPTSVSAQSSTVYDLSWPTSQEMHIGGDVTITASASVQDAEGATIVAPLSDTDTGAGIGVAPYVVSITADNASPTNAAQVNYSILFSEDVSGFGPSECTLTAVTGTLSGSSFFVSGAGNTYAAVVNRGTGDVSFRLDVPANASIIDGAGNAMTAAFTGGDVYVIQELHIAQDLPASHYVTAGDHVSHAVTTTGGVSPKTYVWYYAADSGGPYTVLADQTTGTLDINPVAVEDEGYYYLTVSDANESVDSATMHLVIDDGIPVAGLLGLGVLATALGVAGRRAARRE